MLYDCYIQLKVRRVIAEKDVPLERACEFMVNTPGGIASDSSGNFYSTTKELKDAQSVKPPVGIELDSSVTGIGSVPESSYRQLLGTLGDNSE